jgi:hypothetical protein
MNLKDNINKIHLDLTNKFEDVSISEKSSPKLGNYIELCINESGLNLKAMISKSNLESKSFNWIYLSNPSNGDSIVERKSSVDSFSNDIQDIFEKNRFDSDYIKSLK